MVNKIEESQDEFNAGKFRGTVFQINYVAKEEVRCRPLTSRISKIGTRNSKTVGRLVAGQSIRESLSANKRLNEFINYELSMQQDSASANS